MFMNATDTKATVVVVRLGTSVKCGHSGHMMAAAEACLRTSVVDRQDF